MKDLIIHIDDVANRIFNLRGTKVLLDSDLAALYGTETRTLKQAVKRNIERFPLDFLFVLTKDEVRGLVSQNVIASHQVLGGASPYAFTEQGVAMLSSVLRSKKAIETNIEIMRAFVAIRRNSAIHQMIFDRLDNLESEFDSLREFVRSLLIQETKSKPRIGFFIDDNE